MSLVSNEELNEDEMKWMYKYSKFKTNEHNRIDRIDSNTTCVSVPFEMLNVYKTIVCAVMPPLSDLI